MDSRGYYESPDVDSSGPGAAPDKCNGMVRPVDAQQAYAQRLEAKSLRRWQGSRKEVQQTFQASAARTESSGSRTHFRNSASPGKRWLVQRRAQWKVGRFHHRSDEEVPDRARPESQRQARRANTAKTRSRLANRRCSRTDAANNLILDSNQGRPDGPAPVTSFSSRFRRLNALQIPNLICIPSKSELES